MGQISGAIIGVTVVLIAVFVPLAFFAGSVGNIYRQFSAVMVSVHGVLGLPGLVADPRLVRHAAQACRGRPRARQDRLLRLVQPPASTPPPKATKAWWPAC